MSNLRLLKSIAVKGDVTGNKLACIPSVCGNLDSYDDVIFPPKKAGVPGPFAKAIPGFMKSGFNPLDHQWEWSAIVAYPTMIEERGNQLYSECEFHSDQASQDALTKCRERLAPVHWLLHATGAIYLLHVGPGATRLRQARRLGHVAL
jgi:hypothetical protein